jgi:hypothetical protein
MAETNEANTGQPSQEEVQAYMEQLRQAAPSELIAQSYSMLGTGAEVKLGEENARLLIDGMHALVEAVADRLENDDLAQQMRDGVGRLQAAQVQAERQQGETAGEGQSAAEATSAGEPQSSQGGAGAPSQDQPPQQGRQGQNATDNLGIPGR